jgi:hypothetical protein
LVFILKVAISKGEPMRKLLLAALTIPLLTLAGGSAEPKVDADPWASYRFLIGEWEGEGSGQPGQAKGKFSFGPELQGKILVRKHRAEVNAAKDRPAAVHEDLLIVYQPEPGKESKAIYFDSEGHVVQYAAHFSQDEHTLTMVSDARPSSPRFRLSYTRQAEGRVGIKFEMAPPGKPDAFKSYLDGSARRKQGA